MAPVSGSCGAFRPLRQLLVYMFLLPPSHQLDPHLTDPLPPHTRMKTARLNAENAHPSPANSQQPPLVPSRSTACFFSQRKRCSRIPVFQRKRSFSVSSFVQSSRWTRAWILRYLIPTFPRHERQFLPFHSDAVRTFRCFSGSGGARAASESACAVVQSGSGASATFSNSAHRRDGEALKGI